MLNIRTQDRETLMECNYFDIVETTYIGEETSEFSIYAGITPNDVDIIGSYATKERALEVLDEIQIASLYDQKFSNEYTIYLADGSQKQMIPIPYVYQMPKE